MATTFENFIQSHQFTFFVGREGKPIIVHAAAIAATSQQLDALINGGMGESETRCVKIEDVEVDDFIHFCEYAYRGDYTHDASDSEWKNYAIPLSKKDMLKAKKARVNSIIHDESRPAVKPFPAEVDTPQEHNYGLNSIVETTSANITPKL